MNNTMSNRKNNEETQIRSCIVINGNENGNDVVARSPRGSEAGACRPDGTSLPPYHPLTFLVPLVPLVL